MLINEIKEVIKSCNKKEIRKFALTMGIFLLFVGAFLWWQYFHGFVYIIMGGLSLLIIGWLIPDIIKPVYIIWMSFAVMLGYIMTRILLTIIFCLLFIPVGLILRIFRKDILNERFDKMTDTYWIKREKKEFNPEDAGRQF